MKKRKILIIGLGKIGLNHLKAAKKFQKKINIYVFDKKKIEKKVLKNKNIQVLHSLKNQNIYDLAIISTNSEERFKVFLNLVKNNTVKNILFEKFVYFQKSEFKKTIAIIKKNKINAWVNCIRREILIFQKLKKKLFGKFELIFQYKNWGMACNSIHFVDLFSFLSGSSKIKIMETKLDNKIYRSKRKGYMEFKGSIKIKAKNSSLLFEDNNINNSKIFKVISKNKIFSFNKKENILNETQINTNHVKKYKCEQPKVSLISYKIIDKILNNKKIKLTKLNESLIHHNILIDIFSGHLKKNYHKKKLKIT